MKTTTNDYKFFLESNFVGVDSFSCFFKASSNFFSSKRYKGYEL